MIRDRAHPRLEYAGDAGDAGDEGYEVLEPERYDTVARAGTNNLRGMVSRIRGEAPLGMVRAARKVLWARWSLRRATTIGRYVQLTGRLKVTNRGGRLIIGDKVRFHASITPSVLTVLEGGELRIGDRAFVNYGADICATKRVLIGEECRIGAYCIIMDNDFHQVDLVHRDEMPASEDVIIEANVWLGNRVTVLPGVRIGFGSVIGAGSVVTKDVPPMVVAGGVPARVIRKIEQDT